MKAIKLILASFFLFVGFSSFNVSSVPAQPVVKPTPKAQEFFSYLRCHRQAKNIVVNWGATSTAGVDYFVVYHSEDLGDSYFPVGDPIPATSDKKYSFKHLEVYPGYHYYYIQAVMLAGPPVNSTIDIVRIVSHG